MCSKGDDVLGRNDKLFTGFNTSAIIRPPLLLPADGQLSNALEGERTRRGG